jgi:hypothetical protein
LCTEDEWIAMALKAPQAATEDEPGNLSWYPKNQLKHYRVITQ